jgi:hypothetical protein
VAKLASDSLALGGCIFSSFSRVRSSIEARLGTKEDDNHGGARDEEGS